MPIRPDARSANFCGIRLMAEDEVCDLRDMERLAGPDATLHDAALRRLYSRHAADLTRVVRRIVSSESDSTDVVQEIFVLVWQQANRYDVHRGTVGAWLAMMARSRATDVRRARHASKRRPVIDTTQPTNIAAVEGLGTDYGMLHAGITLLPEPQRRLVDLAYFEGLSHSQIAHETGLPVRAESRGEQLGACFTVSLPVAATLTVGTSASPVEESGATAGANSRLDGVRILAVEDNVETRELLSVVLQAAGAVVTAVSSVSEALAVFSESAPDVLISDIAMPSEDGYTFIHRVRALEHDGNRHVPAVALTGYAFPEDRNRAMLAGFEVHIAKPVEPERLTAAIADLVARNRPPDQSGGR